MKKNILGLFCAIIIAVVAFNMDKISTFITNQITKNNPVVTLTNNEYAKTSGFKYVQIKEDLVPYSYHDLLDIIFTIINSGQTTATFYCPSEYENCTKDISEISKDSLILTHINNFVHPYNSFTEMETIIYETGEINLKINHVYSEDKIASINNEVDNILKEIYNENKSDKDNIKAIHDYIINHTKYDQERNELGTSSYESNTAYGAALNNYATCNGYSDYMAIFLNKLGITNYKIATTSDRISYDSKGHVWNAVYLDGAWYHLDLTWDDPVADNGKDYLYYKYFLVTTDEMKESDGGEVTIEEHNFDPSVYLEFNESIKDIISS